MKSGAQRPGVPSTAPGGWPGAALGDTGLGSEQGQRPSVLPWAEVLGGGLRPSGLEPPPWGAKPETTQAARSRTATAKLYGGPLGRSSALGPQRPPTVCEHPRSAT